MADEYTNELAQAAQRLAAALRPKTPAGLTIKLISGDIKSVAADGSSAVVDVGEGDINALNKSGDRLAAGESVWLGYTKSLADAVILFRAGLSKPGVGEDLGNGNERFNDYVNNVTDGGSNVAYNTLKGANNSATQYAKRNLICGSHNQVYGGASDNIVGGSDNQAKDGVYRSAIFGSNNMVGGGFSENLVAGSNNNVSAGGGNGNTVIGRFGAIDGMAFSNLIGGSNNSLSNGTFNDNAVFGMYNILNGGCYYNIISGRGNELYNCESNAVCGSNNDIYGNNNIVGGANNICADHYSAVLGEGNLAGFQSISAGVGCYTGYDSMAIGGNCVAGLPEGIRSASDKRTYYNSASKSAGSVAVGNNVIIEDGYRFGCGQYNNYEATAIFQIGDGTGINDKRNAFEVRYNGNAYVEGTYETLGADYAEYEEWLDGNPENEDRAGHFVTYEGDKIRYANASDDYILGVVSAKPAIIGDSDIGYWRKKYQTDIFGRVVYENGAPKISAEYDTQQAYIPRAERAEWSPVGTHGKLIVIDDGTCVVNGYCRPTDGGIGTAAMTGNGAYRVIERLDSTHVKIRLK